VGDQQQTLERMIELGYIMRGLALHYGCKVIVPVQRGELEAVDFLVSALVALRLPKESIVIGIPSKKSATTPAQLRALAQALKEQGVEAPFHLLGMGPKSKGWAAMVRAIRDSFPQATIYSDSVDIRAQVGRTNGPQGGARRITVAQDRARARGVTGSDIKAAALIEVGTQDARAAAQAARRQGWFDPELESAPGVPLEPGCISYGPGGPFGQEPHQQLLLLTKEV
jgi:hypothetical protein